MQDKVLRVFLYHDKLKFNEIEKLTKLRSNILAYYLKNLEKERLIMKEGDAYSLSGEFEYIIPYISDRQAMLPAVLIAIGRGNKFFLPERKKKPYKGLLGMPAGRILLGENIEDAVKRIMREKYGINAEFKHVNSVSLEHVKKEGRIIHSFIQILVTAEIEEKISYIDIEKNREKVIESDYFFLKKHKDKRYELETINSEG